MSLDEVFAAISGLEMNSATNLVDLSEACGEICAMDYFAQKNLPAYDNSALDGYAFCYDDRDLPLKIKGEILAGDKNTYEIKRGECYKIMTGATFALGSDSVVRIEDAKFDENGNLLVPQGVRRFEARKIKGEELKIGEKFLGKHDILTPANIMLLASQGISKVRVFSRPRIRIFSSGDELSEPWESCDEKGIFNANACGLRALLAQNGFKSEYSGILKDDKSQIKKAILDARNYGIIALSGGASKGSADFMREILIELGFSEIFGSVALRPASPTKLYQKGDLFVCVLPGNPMSCMFGAFFSLLPLARKLSGFKEILPRKITATIGLNSALKASRANVVLGNYAGGEFTPVAKFSSSMITPLANSNAFYASKLGESELRAGQSVEIFLI